MAPTSGVSRILVIESDAEPRKNLSQLLATHGYGVEEAGNGEEEVLRIVARGIRERRNGFVAEVVR